MGKRYNFTHPFLATLSTSVLAIVAREIIVTFDAMYTAPFASSDDLAAFWPYWR